MKRSAPPLTKVTEISLGSIYGDHTPLRLLNDNCQDNNDISEKSSPEKTHEMPVKRPSSSPQDDLIQSLRK